MMKFWMTPGSCSTGIHILVEELDLLYEVHILNMPDGEHRRRPYLDINPKGSIPALTLEDGRTLTEFQAIAWWLARSFPRAGLLPEDSDGEVRTLELMDYVIATIHMQGFARLFTTDTFCADPAQHEAVRARGREIINESFALVDRSLGDRNWILDRFSIADAALFYVEFWAMRTDIELPAACRRHYQQMLKRPAVRQVLMEEGYREGIA